MRVKKRGKPRGRTLARGVQLRAALEGGGDLGRRMPAAPASLCIAAASPAGIPGQARQALVVRDRWPPSRRRRAGGIAPAGTAGRFDGRSASAMPGARAAMAVQHRRRAAYPQAVLTMMLSVAPAAVRRARRAAPRPVDSADDPPRHDGAARTALKRAAPTAGFTVHRFHVARKELRAAKRNPGTTFTAERTIPDSALRAPSGLREARVDRHANFSGRTPLPQRANPVARHQLA